MAVLAALACARAASAQTPSAVRRDPDAFVNQQRTIDERIRKEIDEQLGAAAHSAFDWGGWYSNYLFLYDDGVESSRTFRRFDLRVWGRLTLEDGTHEFYVRPRASYLDFNSGDSYDGNDNLTSVTNVSLNYVTVYEYDGEGRLTRTTDARGNSTMFGYDARGQLTSVTNPLGHTSQTAYDAVGNVTAQIDALGKTIAQMQYDALNNLLSRQNALGHTTAYQYDALNRLMRTTDPLGRQTNFTHDALNRMVAATDHLGGTAGQGFNTDGYRVTLTDPNNNTLSFTYDPAGRLTAVTSQLGNVIAYEYNNRGLLSKSTNGRGQETTYAYDAAGRLLQLVEPEGATSYT